MEGAGLPERAAGILLATMMLGGCCCYAAPATGPAHANAIPVVPALPVPAPVASQTDTLTRLAMRNVLFHIDDSILMHVRELRGTAQDLAGDHVLVLDDKRRMLLRLAYAEVGLTGQSLSDLFNRYVFAYRGSPLRRLVVRTRGNEIEQSGILHKVVDIPFQMRAQVSVTGDGRIRLHPTSMKICSIPGKGLMRALGVHFEDLLDLSGAHGVTVSGDDLILDPLRILPPPRIEGRLTAARVEGDEVVEVFGSKQDPAATPLAPPVAAPNYILFEGGALRFGKLYMVHTELEAIDTDPADAFDFYLDYYANQLVSGYHRTLPDNGLVAWMPDFGDLPSPTEPPS